MNYYNSFRQDKQALLSTLWIFVLINALFRNLHGFLQLSALSEITTGYIDSTALVVLSGGIVLQLQIAMIALSRILPEAINRWANLMVAVLSILLVITTDHKNINDVFFAFAQTIGLISICWFALSTIRLVDIFNFIDMPTRP